MYVCIGKFYVVLMTVATRPSKLHKMYQCWCIAKNFWWWAERLPKTCRVVIPIKLEFSVSVGYIHKEPHFIPIPNTQKNYYCLFPHFQHFTM